MLTLAILSEVTATVNLRLSEGFTKPFPSIVAVVGYIVAFGLLSQILKMGMSIGVAYGVWAASGIALVAFIGAIFLGDKLSLVQVGGIVLMIGGVLAIELGATTR